MQTFQNTVTIARPAGEVFAFLAHLRNIPRWNYAIARTVPTSPGPPGAGAAYRQTRTIPRRSEESLQITVFQPPTRRTVQGQLGPFRAAASYLLEPVPSGTRLANDVELAPRSAPLRPIGPPAVPRVKAGRVCCASLAGRGEQAEDGVQCWTQSSSSGSALSRLASRTKSVPTPALACRIGLVRPNEVSRQLPLVSLLSNPLLA